MVKSEGGFDSLNRVKFTIELGFTPRLGDAPKTPVTETKGNAGRAVEYQRPTGAHCYLQQVFPYVGAASPQPLAEGYQLGRHMQTALIEAFWPSTDRRCVRADQLLLGKGSARDDLLSKRPYLHIPFLGRRA
jgi:hypothetical protein